MKYLQKFTESFLSSDKSKAINLIISYIKKNSKLDLNVYDEIWHIQKGNKFLNGQLYLSLKSTKAIRLNWIENDLRSEIDSIDMWLDFEFESNPNFTLNTNGESISKILPSILNFIKSPEKFIKSNEEFDNINFVSPTGYDPQKELDDAEKKLKRLRNKDRIEQQIKRIDQLKASIAYDKERSETNSEKLNSDNELKIDTFKTIERYTLQVAKGKSNSAIITGQSGVGKTQIVIDTLSSLGMVKNVHYYYVKGTTTTAALFETLFRHRSKLIVFDDCDSVFEEKDSVNILKAALDTYDIREVSRLLKTHFDSTGMDDDEIQNKYDETGKLPNTFDFKGQIIFISNLSEKNFDSALISRSLHEDVKLNRTELVNRMKELMNRISPDVDYDKKEEALNYLDHITSTYPTKFDLDLRTLIHSINLRANNDDIMSIGGKEEFVWKLLIKKYLIR